MSVSTESGALTTSVGPIHRKDLQAPLLHSVSASIITTVAVLGLIGNTLCAIVLTRMEKTAKNMKLLKYLSFVDIPLLVLGYIDFAMGFIDSSHNLVDTVRNGLLPIAHPLALTVYTLEIYLTVLIAVQRAVVVSRPLHHSRLMDESFIFKFILLMMVFAVGFNVPHWVASPPTLYWEKELNMTWMRNDASEYGMSREYREIYSGYLTLVIRTAIPMVILVVANTVIVVNIYRNRKARREMTKQGGQSRRTERTTVIIIAITSMSILTHFTSAAARILHAFWETDMNLAKESFLILSIILIIVNSSSNFLFYCMFGKEFRAALKAMFIK